MEICHTGYLQIIDFWCCDVELQSFFAFDFFLVTFLLGNDEGIASFIDTYHVHDFFRSLGFYGVWFALRVVNIRNEFTADGVEALYPECLFHRLIPCACGENCGDNEQNSH